MNGRFWAGVALFAVAGSAVAAGRAEGGRLLKTVGDVTIERNGTVVVGEKGAVISQGDTLRTGSDGKAQWWMQDDSLFVLPSNSALHIDEYALPQNNSPATGRSFMSLLKGAMRSVTGLIAHSNSSSYKITTPVATMGVRGTDFSLVLCESDECDRTKSGARKMGAHQVFDFPRLIKTARDVVGVRTRLFLRMDKGTGILCNSGGCTEIAAGAGASCAVAAAGEKPAPVGKCPAVFVHFDAELDFDFDAGDIDIFRDIERIIPEPPGSPS